jgi:hypothetical protein
MKAVIYKPRKDDPRIQRLVDHIKAISKVEVEVIEGGKDPDWLPHLGRQNESFRTTALKLKEDFVWLEPDSIPLCESWFEELKERWGDRGEGIIALMSTDYHTPFDLIGGIGIYSPKVAGRVPTNLLTHGFDGWIADLHRDSVERTGLIQHSYGAYDRHGTAKPHGFPRDSFMLRETSVIFHADKGQTLIDWHENEQTEDSGV